jgi:hypothetical protein
MALIDEIEESKRLGDAYGRNESLSDVLSEAKALFSKIRDSENEIIRLFQDAKNMREIGLISGNEVLDILNLLIETREDVLKNADYKPNKYGLILKNAKKEQEGINETWRKYIQKEIETSRSIVDTLCILVENSQRYNKLVELYNDIKANMRPGNKEALRKIEQYKQLADELIKDLNLKQSILRFFERMADRNVLSLSEMTPDVWAWIHQHHFEDRFTIKISNKERG